MTVEKNCWKEAEDRIAISSLTKRLSGQSRSTYRYTPDFIRLGDVTKNRLY